MRVVYQPAVAQPKESAGIPTPDWISCVAGIDDRYASGCYDGFVRLYQPGTAAPLLSAQLHALAVTSVDMFATSEELLVASGGKDCAMKLSAAAVKGATGVQKHEREQWKSRGQALKTIWTRSSRFLLYAWSVRLSFVCFRHSYSSRCDKH